MERLTFGFRALIALLLLTGCSQQIGPSSRELKQELSEKISTSVEDFEVEGTENLGTQTEPKIQSRFRATLKYTEEDFSEVPEMVELLRKQDRLGKEFAEIHGLSTSTRKGSQWATEFTVEEQKNLLKE